MSTVRAGLFSDPDEACRHLAASQSRKTDPCGLFDLGQIIADGMPVRLVESANGETVGGYVVQPFGPVLWVTAAAGRADAPLCQVIDATVTAQARMGGFVAVGFRTVRRGLVKRAEQLGYALTRQDGNAYYMRKNLA